MVRAAPSGFDFADVVVAAVEAALGDVFGLNKSAKLFFGDADGFGAGVAMAVFFRAAFDAGSINGWVLGAAEAVAAGDASVAAPAFLCDFFAGEGDASAPADAAGEASAVVAFFRDFLAGDADASAAGDSLAAGDASAPAAFLCECLAGDAEGDGVGD